MSATPPKQPSTTRRRHKKSRLGCLECKKRHVRCDETRPVCLNCRIANRPCPYISADSTNTPVSPSANPPAVQTPTSGVDDYGVPHASAPAAVTAPPPLPIEPLPPITTVNMEHLRLYHVFSTESCRLYVPLAMQEGYAKVMISEALKNSYLMSECLAFAALQLSIRTTSRDTALYYHNQSVSLQSEALRLFHAALPSLSESNCAPFMLFSQHIGLHSMCNTITAREATTLGGLLARLDETMALMRGILTIVSPYWLALLDSPLGPFLKLAQDHVERPESAGHVLDTCPKPPTDELLRLLTASDLAPAVMATYAEAVHQLTVQFDLMRRLRSADHLNSTYGAFIWFILTPSEYSELLAQRQPEALVILAWFTVILHRYRNMWVVGDGGAMIFGLIEAHLGARWDGWLAWPREQFRTAQAIQP